MSYNFGRGQYHPWISASLNKKELMKKSAKELEKIGRKHGIELDKRLKKETIVEQLYVVL
jgi:hypothetical protein|tara:strand:- start:71 stop:250 length:180 start_codon:yes stop_codon:yes gene_type:complete